MLFDAVGTLIHPWPPVGIAYAQGAAEFGLKLTGDEVTRRFRRAWQESESRLLTSQGLRTSQAAEVDRWRRIVARVFPEAEPLEPLFERLWRHFGEPQHWRLDPAASQILAGLHAAGYVVGLASNFDQRLHGLCRQLSPLDRLSHVFVSSDLGYRKPALKFFRAVERQLNLQPRQLLLVGDDVRNDYHAARRAGWSAWLIAPKGGPPPADLATGAVSRNAGPTWPSKSIDVRDCIRGLAEVARRLGLD